MITRKNNHDLINISLSTNLKRIIDDGDVNIFTQYEIVMPKVTCTNFSHAKILQKEINEFISERTKRLIGEPENEKENDSI